MANQIVDVKTLDFTIDELDETLDFTIDPYVNVASTNYNDLINKPQINGVTLIGNKTSQEIHVQDHMDAATVAEIEAILYLNV